MFESIGTFFTGFAAGVLTLWTLDFFLFWGVFTLFCLISTSVFENYSLVGLLAAATLLLLALTDAVNPLNYVAAHPWQAISYVLAYAGIGLVWIVIRWVRFIELMRPLRATSIKDFFERYSDTEVAFAEWKTFVINNGFAPKENVSYQILELNKTLSSHLRQYGRSRDLGTATEAPAWSDHKSTYAAYFFYWPLDLLTYFLQDVLRDVWKAISNFIQHGFDTYSRKRMLQPIKFK